jgi:hypothetical protein
MKVTVRLAEEKDVEQFLDWSKNTPNNLFDPKIANYPSLRTLAVDVNGEPADFIPFHPCMVVESIAHRPGISPRLHALVLARAQQALEKLAQSYQMAEVWWMCADESLIKAAQARGYEVVQTTVLRKKVTPHE